MRTSSRRTGDIKGGSPFDPSCLIYPGMTLRPHQVDFVTSFMTSESHGIIAVHPTGSGKTALALAIAKCYLSENPANTVVLCTPKTLLNNYYRELDKMEGGAIDPVRLSRYRIFSIDSFYLGYMKYNNGVNLPPDDMSDDSSDSNVEEETLTKDAYSTKSTLFIIDEGHNLKTDMGKRAQIYIKAAAEADRVLITTATPLVNRVSDAANLISMVSKTPIMKRKEFEEIMLDRGSAKKLVGGKFDFYSLSAIDMLEYPTVSYDNVYLRMPDALYTYYKAQEMYLNGKSDDDISNDFFGGNLSAFYTGVRLAANLTPGELEGTLAKANWVKQFVRANRSSRILIYSQYVRYGCELVKTELSDLGIECGIIYGKMTSAQRDEAVRRYNAGLLNILIISKCGREGLDLKMTDVVIMYENGWNTTNEDQVVGRAVRRGSHAESSDRGNVHVYRMLMVKPEEFDSGAERVMDMPGKFNHVGQLKSIDLLLMSMANEKRIILDNAFNMLKVFNTEVANETAALKIDGDVLSKALNSYVLGMLEMKPFAKARGNANLGNPVLSSLKKVYIQIALARFKSIASPIIIEREHNEDEMYIRGRWSDGWYEVYLVTRMKKTDYIDMEGLVSHVKSISSSMAMNGTVVRSILKGMKRIGPLVKDKMLFVKIIARLTILGTGLNKTCMLLDLFGRKVFTRWYTRVINDEVHISSSFDDDISGVRRLNVLVKGDKDDEFMQTYRGGVDEMIDPDVWDLRGMVFGDVDDDSVMRLRNANMTDDKL